MKIRIRPLYWLAFALVWQVAPAQVWPLPEMPVQDPVPLSQQPEQQSELQSELQAPPPPVVDLPEDAGEPPAEMAASPVGEGGDTVPDRATLPQEAAIEGQAVPATPLTPPDPEQFVGPPPPDPEANEFGVSPMKILGGKVLPGTRQRLSWTTGQSFSGSVMETPVIVVHGERTGPRLCLTGGVHGDELNGVEVVRRLAWSIEPEELSGTIIAVPIVNLLGFSRGSRYLPDRRDLNRFFPGSRNGSSASRIAYSFFEAVIRHCDALVDFHTGSFERANLPQVRGDLTNPAVVAFTRGFGATAVLHSPGEAGMLRYATSHRGIPAVTFEIGGPMRLDPKDIEHSVQAIETLMHAMGMSDDRRRWAEPQAVFYESRWIRVDHGGMLFSEVELGDRVRRGDVLGRVIDPVSNHASQVLAPEDGRIIGMALNQLVLPGFAAYHLGIAASEERVVTEATMQAEPDDERFLEYDQLDPEPEAEGEGGGDTLPRQPSTPDPERDLEREDG
jgi:predicted deacylase